MNIRPDFEFHCKSSIANFQDPCWVSPPRRTLRVVGFGGKRRAPHLDICAIEQAVPPRMALQFSARHPHTVQPPAPSRAVFIGVQTALRSMFPGQTEGHRHCPAAHKGQQGWIQRPSDRPSNHARSKGCAEGTQLFRDFSFSKTHHPPRSNCVFLGQARYVFAGAAGWRPSP